MTELVDRAREVGGDELAEQVEALLDELESVENEEQELREWLKDETDLSEDVVDDMEPSVLREVAEEFEHTNVEIPVAGGGESKTVALNRSPPETHEREVEIPVAGGDDDPETVTVAYEGRGPSVESINEFTQWLNQARHETSEPVDEEQPTGAIPSMEYMNVEDVDESDSDIPVAGGGDERN